MGGLPVVDSFYNDTLLISLLNLKVKKYVSSLFKRNTRA